MPEPPDDRRIGPAAVYRRRTRRFQDVEHRSVSQSDACDPGDHRAGARPLCRGDGALLHWPMEIGLYTTPGIEVIRSTSFYGLSFVRVSFKYGVDYFFAYSQAAVALAQNVRLARNQVPSIQANSSTGEIYCYYRLLVRRIFRIINLRTVSSGTVARRLLTIPGIQPSSSRGGPTKNFRSSFDPSRAGQRHRASDSDRTGQRQHQRGPEIRIGQQSINIRGVGRIYDGGSDDLKEGYKVEIQNVVLSQGDGVPVLMKDVGEGLRRLPASWAFSAVTHTMMSGRSYSGGRKDRRHDSEGEGGNSPDPRPRWKSATGSQLFLSTTGRR